MPDDKVSPDEILKEAGAEQPVTEGTFLQRTGLQLATAVGSLGAGITLLLVGRWVFNAPPLPAIQPGTDPAVAKAILENYKTLQQSALEPLSTLFDSVVVKVL